MVLAGQFVPEKRVTLHNISWQCFEYLLQNLGEGRGVKLTYDQGTLEIMTPLMCHEHNNRLIAKLIDILVEELDLNIKSVGSMTCKGSDLQKGVEPDSSFYIQNEPLVRSKQNLDLKQDPPPDLVLEIEYISSDINKLSLYAALGIPEFWCYNGTNLSIYCLQGEQYQKCETSPTFHPIPVQEIPHFLKQSTAIGEKAVKKAFRAWVQAQLASFNQNLKP